VAAERERERPKAGNGNGKRSGRDGRRKRLGTGMAEGGNGSGE
jgi:hypothetical protein